MIIILNYYSLNDLDYERRRLQLAARLRLAGRKFTTNDKIIDQYLKKNNKISLKNACEKLVEKFSINEDLSEKTIYVYFKDKKDDELASLITYGNYSVCGSKILKEIFKLIL